MPKILKNPKARQMMMQRASGEVRVGQVSTARRQLLMGAPDETGALHTGVGQASTSTAPCVIPTAMRVTRTPGGSLRVLDDEQVLLTCSPGGRVRCREAMPDPEDFWNVEDCCWDSAYFDRAAPGSATIPVGQQSNEEQDVEDPSAPGDLDFGFLDEGSECSDTDDEEWLPQSTGNIAARDDLENAPEVSEMVSAIQDADDDVTLLTDPDQRIFDWSSDYSTFRGNREVFTGTPGPTTQCDTPYENFCQIWDQEIMNKIAEETNRYAWQTIVEMTERGQLTKKSRIHDWFDTTIDELYVLFAIFMYMAIDQRTRLEEYWSTDSVLAMPRFRNLMTFRRYQLLTKFLHFVDNYSLPQRGDDRKVAKLQPIIDHCNKKFQSCYVPHQYIAVDESLTLWKGHLTWIQRIVTILDIKDGRLRIKVVIVTTFKDVKYVKKEEDGKMLLTFRQAALLAMVTFTKAINFCYNRLNSSKLMSPLCGAIFSRDSLEEMAKELNLEEVKVLEIINESSTSGGQYLPSSDLACAVVCMITTTKRVTDKNIRNLMISKVVKQYIHKHKAYDNNNFVIFANHALGGVPIGMDAETLVSAYQDIQSRGVSSRAKALAIKQAEMLGRGKIKQAEVVEHETKDAESNTNKPLTSGVYSKIAHPPKK